MFAGKPGRYAKSTEHPSAVDNTCLIDDWSRCIKSLTVSSRENSAMHLVDGSELYWESNGRAGKHWIRLEIQPDILIKSLKILVEPLDNTYMPSLIVVYGGDSFTSLVEFATINVRITDTLVTLLSDVQLYFPCIEIAIKKCWDLGTNCKIHALYITGKKRTGHDDLPANVSFLASDYEEDSKAVVVERVTYPEVWSDSQTKVFVWGLNDKDQLGGLKGSKVKVPVYSEALTALKPIHIAGGSKSLFIVSCDGKVSETAVRLRPRTRNQTLLKFTVNCSCTRAVRERTEGSVWATATTSPSPAS